LFSHGFSGSVGQFSEMIRAFQQESCGVIALDLPGHGKSSSGSSNAIEFSETIEKVLSIESISMVVAHSLSGIAMAISMEQSGLRPLKQVLLATSVESKDIMTDFIKEINASYRIREQLVNLLQRRFNRSFNDFSVFEIFNEMHDLPPTLYILDEDDAKIPIEHLDKMSQINRVKTMRTQGLGHNKILWNQDVIKEVLKFYREQ
jgi:pimeloyl-ACP methyl ester carboxylesterase